MNEPTFIRAGTLDELRDRHRVVVSTPSGAVLVVAEGQRRDRARQQMPCPSNNFILKITPSSGGWH